MAFSPDGRFIYLKGASYKYGGHVPIKNSIVDVASGKLLLEFNSAMDGNGFAASKNGAHLAIGNRHSVQILSLQ
jgi:hypothetical protein